MTKLKQKKNYIVKSKEYLSVEELATILEEIAQKLKSEGTFSVVEGDKVTEVTPSNRLKVDIEYSTKRDKHEFEIEFEWRLDESNKGLTIE